MTSKFDLFSKISQLLPDGMAEILVPSELLALLKPGGMQDVVLMIIKKQEVKTIILSGY